MIVEHNGRRVRVVGMQVYKVRRPSGDAYLNGSEYLLVNHDAHVPRRGHGPFCLECVGTIGGGLGLTDVGTSAVAEVYLWQRCRPITWGKLPQEWRAAFLPFLID